MDSNYKAEDLLSGQVPKGKENTVSENEQHVAEEIKSAIRSSGNETLTPLEIAGLWGAIRERSGNDDIPKRNWKRYLQIAAMLVMTAGVSIWIYQKNTATTKLLDFAAQNINKKVVVKNPATESSFETSTDAEQENIITTNDFNTLVVGDGQRSAIILPDSTRVWLNSGSRLIFPVKFDAGSREVYLEGQAYFDVSHDEMRPFTVRAKDMNIRVLGTEFYVSSDAARKSNYAVLVSGSINFSTGGWLNKMERTLVPGEKINYNPEDDELEISTIKTADIQSWKEGYLDVKSESLDMIVQRIGIYYNMEISTEGIDLSEEKFTGKLVFQRSATDVIDLLCNGTQYYYDSEERRIERRNAN